jgi:hypothetical protein
VCGVVIVVGVVVVVGVALSGHETLLVVGSSASDEPDVELPLRFLVGEGVRPAAADAWHGEVPVMDGNPLDADCDRLPLGLLGRTCAARVLSCRHPLQSPRSKGCRGRDDAQAGGADARELLRSRLAGRLQHAVPDRQGGDVGHPVQIPVAVAVADAELARAVPVDDGVVVAGKEFSVVVSNGGRDVAVGRAIPHAPHAELEGGQVDPPREVSLGDLVLPEHGHHRARVVTVDERWRGEAASIFIGNHDGLAFAAGTTLGGDVDVTCQVGVRRPKIERRDNGPEGAAVAPHLQLGYHHRVYDAVSRVLGPGSVIRDPVYHHDFGATPERVFACTSGVLEARNHVARLESAVVVCVEEGRHWCGEE